VRLQYAEPSLAHHASSLDVPSSRAEHEEINRFDDRHFLRERCRIATHRMQASLKLLFGKLHENRVGSPALYRVTPFPPNPTAHRFSISSPAPSAVKDEPRILSSSIASNCPTCADGEPECPRRKPSQRTRELGRGHPRCLVNIVPHVASGKLYTRNTLWSIDTESRSGGRFCVLLGAVPGIVRPSHYRQTAPISASEIELVVLGVAVLVTFGLSLALVWNRLNAKQ
jgi:hypothetical protein